MHDAAAAPAPPKRPPPLRWGLAAPAHDDAAARRADRLWRAPVLLGLLATIPAFYAELLHEDPPPLSFAGYLASMLLVAGALAHTAARCRQPARHLRANVFDPVLAAGLLAAALLPPSSVSGAALAWRLAVALGVMVRMAWALRELFTRGSLPYLLMLALVVFALCGAGFWWLEPRTPHFGDALWLAFETAATVGYGDVVPTVPASRIFAVFVVLLGYGVLTVVTAAIAARWVETEERAIEKEILHDLHREVQRLRGELQALRGELAERR